MDQMVNDFWLFELLEFRPTPGAGAVEWDAVGWVGGDYHRLWLKSEGQWERSAEIETEFQALYGRMIAPFYDFQAGIRYDRVWGQSLPASRFHGVIGVQGLAPYLFELEPAFFISQDGQLSARLTASRELLLTQRTYLQARMETNAALQSAEAFGIGAGWNDLELGLRLRHELAREFAPYVGVTWNNRFGETAAITLRNGVAPSNLSFVAGVRAWY